MSELDQSKEELDLIAEDENHSTILEDKAAVFDTTNYEELTLKSIALAKRTLSWALLYKPELAKEIQDDIRKWEDELKAFVARTSIRNNLCT